MVEPRPGTFVYRDPTALVDAYNQGWSDAKEGRAYLRLTNVRDRSIAWAYQRGFRSYNDFNFYDTHVEAWHAELLDQSFKRKAHEAPE